MECVAGKRRCRRHVIAYEKFGFKMLNNIGVLRTRLYIVSQGLNTSAFFGREDFSEAPAGVSMVRWSGASMQPHDPPQARRLCKCHAIAALPSPFISLQTVGRRIRDPFLPADANAALGSSQILPKCRHLIPPNPKHYTHIYPAAAAARSSQLKTW